MELIVKAEDYVGKIMMAGQYSDCSDTCTEHDGCGDQCNYCFT